MMRCVVEMSAMMDGCRQLLSLLNLFCDRFLDMSIGCALAFFMVFSRQAGQLYILRWLASVLRIGGRIAYSVVALHHLYFLFLN